MNDLQDISYKNDHVFLYLYNISEKIKVHEDIIIHAYIYIYIYIFYTVNVFLIKKTYWSQKVLEICFRHFWLLPTSSAGNMFPAYAGIMFPALLVFSQMWWQKLNFLSHFFQFISYFFWTMFVVASLIASCQLLLLYLAASYLTASRLFLFGIQYRGKRWRWEDLAMGKFGEYNI